MKLVKMRSCWNFPPSTSIFNKLACYSSTFKILESNHYIQQNKQTKPNQQQQKHRRPSHHDHTAFLAVPLLSTLPAYWKWPSNNEIQTLLLLRLNDINGFILYLE